MHYSKYLKAIKPSMRNSIPRWLIRRRKRVFVDCGGYDGCSVVKFLLKHPGFDCITFEPNPELWEYYENLPTKLEKKAVADFNGKVRLYIDPVDADGSSVLKEKKIVADNSISNSQCPVLEVECVDISEYLSKLCDEYSEVFLKLDVEGAEYRILEKLIRSGCMERLKKLFCEFHWSKIGMDEAVHLNLIARLKQFRCFEEEEWDSLEFAVHPNRNKRLMKIRETILERICEDRRKE